MQGPLRAVTAVAGFGMVSLLLPPLALLSSAALALVSLRLGLRQGLIVTLLSTLLVSLMGWLLGLPLILGLVTAMVQWIPVLLLAEVLRRSLSWALTIMAGVGVACVGVVLIHLLIPDVTAFWVSFLQQALAPLLAQPGVNLPDSDTALIQIAQVMTGTLAAVTLMGMLLALILGRYWQALLYNLGGFREEFHALRLGRGLALLGIGLLMLAWLAESTVVFEVALPFLVAFFLHGLALLHASNRQLGLGRIWLVLAYVIMVVALPQMVIMLATMGMMDSIFDFRARIERMRKD